MASRYWLWILVVAAVAVALIYMSGIGGRDASAPGQPAPHALDQSE